jgi:hypothetical protein
VCKCVFCLCSASGVGRVELVRHLASRTECRGCTIWRRFPLCRLRLVEGGGWWWRRGEGMIGDVDYGMWANPWQGG